MNEVNEMNEMNQPNVNESALRPNLGPPPPRPDWRRRRSELTPSS